MKLLSPNGEELELTIQGYQYPDATEPKKRYSWHMITGGARTADETWSFRYPALTCDESTLLAQWLRRTADWLDDPDPTHRPARLQFTEPNLAFDVAESTGSEAAVTVTLDLEFRSPRHTQRSEAFAAPNVLTLVTPTAALRAAAADWDLDVQAYPNGLA